MTPWRPPSAAALQDSVPPQSKMQQVLVLLVVLMLLILRLTLPLLYFISSLSSSDFVLPGFAMPPWTSSATGPADLGFALEEQCSNVLPCCSTSQRFPRCDCVACHWCVLPPSRCPHCPSRCKTMTSPMEQWPRWAGFLSLWS